MKLNERLWCRNLEDSVELCCCRGSVPSRPDWSYDTKSTTSLQRLPAPTAMASRFAPRLFLRRLRMRRRAQPISSLHEASAESAGVIGDRIFSPSGTWSPPDFQCVFRVFFSARPSSLDEGKGPAAIDYPCVVAPDPFSLERERKALIRVSRSGKNCQWFDFQRLIHNEM